MKVDPNHLQDIINLVLKSNDVKSLAVKLHSGNVRMFRPSLHMFWHSPSGSGKSEILNAIGNIRKVPVYSNLTFPSLVGTIDKNMNFIPAGSWEIRDNIFLIDEFRASYDESDFLDAMNRLWENQSYSRKLGRICPPLIERDKGLYLKVNDGTISINTRFSSITASMYNYGGYSKTSQQVRALMSRCLPVSFVPSKGFLSQLAEGELPLKIVVNRKVKPLDVHIGIDDYRKIKEFVDKYDGLQDNVYLRSIGDLCRVYAIVGRHNYELYKTILDLKNSVRYDKYVFTE